jgi:carbamoyltransferase
MAKYWGLNCLGHDASLCVVENNKLIFHELCSTYTGISKDEYLNESILKDALEFGEPELICYYENTLLKRTRQLYSGEWNKAFSLLSPKTHLIEHNIFYPLKSFSHHETHAAAAYYTSSFDDCLILVADAIGEWETLTVWHGKNNNLEKLHSRKYPYSLGLFYSAFTKLIGLTPTKEENVLTNLSKAGNPKLYHDQVKKYLKNNLHKGIKNWHFNGKKEDLAASVQLIFEEELIKTVEPFRPLSDNFIFTGGCAYNNLAHQKLNSLFKHSYKLKFPGDSSSSVGAVAAHIKNKINM